MYALEKLGWSKTVKGDVFLYVKDDRSFSIHKRYLNVWDDFGDACSIYFNELFALADVLKMMEEIK